MSYSELSADDTRHGTRTGYTHHKCRCDLCKAAYSAYVKEYNSTPKARRKRQEYQQRDYVKQKYKEYRKQPSVRIKLNARMRVKNATAEGRLKNLNRVKAWRNTPRGKLLRRQSQQRRRNRLMRADPDFRLTNILRKRLANALKAAQVLKMDRTISLLGCTVGELRVHLERQFKPGMNWTNCTYTGWQVDHIKPISEFNLLDPEQQRICFNFKNLQPLWAEEHRIKSASEARIRNTNGLTKHQNSNNQMV